MKKLLEETLAQLEALGSERMREQNRSAEGRIASGRVTAAHYYGSLAQRLTDRPLVVHVHAAVFTGWLALFAAQTVLAATGRIHAHVRLGEVGVWYGGGLIALGVYTGVVRAAAQPALAVASVGRMDSFPAPPLGRFMRFLLWSSPLQIAMAHDARRRRTLHPVYAMGLLAFAVRIWSVPLARTPEWARFAEWIYAFVR